MIGRGAWRLAIAVLLLVAAPIGATASTSTAPSSVAAPRPAALAAWTGGLNLYRDGVYSEQATWFYCTAADIQMIKNMVEGTEDHSASSQALYFEWMRTKNRYDIPESAGIDPAGWAAGMAHFVDSRYELVSSPSFNGTLKTAVTRMRLTNLPVALAVAHGNHGWVLHGFTATADPAVSADFTITSVAVTGPLWGRQNSSYGYDMPPNKTLTLGQLADFFTRWHYDPLPMIWDGSFVSIQPKAEGEVPPPTAAPATPKPAPAVTPAPTPMPTPVPTPPAPSATPTALPTLVLVTEPPGDPGPTDPGPTDPAVVSLAPTFPPPASSRADVQPVPDAPAFLVLIALLGVGGAVLVAARRRSRAAGS